MNGGAALSLMALVMLAVLVATIDLSKRRYWLVSGGLGALLLLSAPLVSVDSPPVLITQPVPMPEVVSETQVIRPAVPAPAPSVSTSSARSSSAAGGAIEPAAALDRTG